MYLSRDELKTSNEEVEVAILVNGIAEETITLNFLGPRKKSK